MKAKSIRPMDQHVGQQVRIARLAAGLSQEKLGKNALLLRQARMEGSYRADREARSA